MDLLKLLALDEEDLKIVSAHVQDAVMKVGDLDSSRRRNSSSCRCIALPGKRTATERKPQPERRNSVLHFDRVLSAKLSAFPATSPTTCCRCLPSPMRQPTPPAGTVDLVFSGGGAIRLEVECIEARLADLGGAWEASSRPAHKD